MSLLRPACAAVALLGLAACSGGGTGLATPEPSDGAASAVTTPEPAGSQRIVVVGPQFDIWTVQGDGDSLERLTRTAAPIESGANVALFPQGAQRVRYTWPTWSPDGRLAAVSRTPGVSGDALASLTLFEADGTGERQLHETHPRSVGLVARGAPHYAMWAPDSRRLSFVAPRGPGQGLGLFTVRPHDGAPYEVAANAPLYHVWSPDGRYVLIHRREQLLLHDTLDRSTRDLDAPSLRYRVPAFSPDGARIAYVVDEGGTGKLVTSRIDGTDRVAVMDIPGEAAFAWSPTGGRIVVATRHLREPLYDGLYVVEEDGTGAQEPILRGATAAFYWSPDGSRLAHVALADGPLAWQVVDPVTRATRQLADFTPAADFLTHLQFFDQFAPSHHVWSADSTALVFAGFVEGDGPFERNATPRVWVVDATGTAPPRPIAEGRLAFWILSL